MCGTASLSRLPLISIAPQEGIAYALANNYSFIRTDGYVQISNASCGYKCPPLLQYFSSARHDNFLVGSAEHESDAVNTNYILLRVEGYQAVQNLPPPPPPPGWALWPNSPPASIPFEKSEDILDFEFYSGRNANYGNADTVRRRRCLPSTPTTHSLTHSLTHS